MVCSTIFAVHKGTCNLQTPYQFTSLLHRHHNLQRSNQLNKNQSAEGAGGLGIIRSNKLGKTE